MIAARTELLGIEADGKRLPITVEINCPELGEDGLWFCQTSLHGLYPRLSPMRSDDSLHALCMGLFLIRNLLLGFIEEGGRLMFFESPDQEFPVEAYFPPLVQGG